jgi:murein DD-endopeptidase MepM/ murein hydrolase activator NlpD
MAVLVLLVCSASAASAAPMSAARGWSPPLPRPLHVVRPFQAPTSPYGPGHRGVDLGATEGAPVRAPAAGVVRYAGRLVDRDVVSLDSDGLRFSFEPVHPLVRVGQRVAAGAVLGLLEPGHAGCTVCLHWGVRLGERYLDPLRPFAMRVRLLPLDGLPAPPIARASDHQGGSGVPPVALPATVGLGVAALALRRT